LSDFKNGDIVACGRGGWWRVKSKDPHSSNRLILELVMDVKGNLPKKNPRTHSAYSNWCRLVTIEDIKKQREESNTKWEKLLYILSQKEYPIENPEKTKEVLEPDFLTNLSPPPSLSKK
jgi:hypothetical protein